MPTPYIAPVVTRASSMAPGSSWNQAVRPNGAQATVRLNGSTSPASNYVLVTAGDDRVTTKQGARQYDEGNDYRLTLVRTQSVSRVYFRLQATQGNNNYQDVSVVSANARFNGAAGNALRVIIEYGEEASASVTPADSWEDPVIRIVVTQDTTMAQMHTLLEADLDTTMWQISTLRGSGTAKPRTGTYSPGRTGRDAITAGATYDAETKTITLAAASTQTLTGASTAIGGLDGFSAAVVGTGTTRLEAVFAGRAFTGGVTESGQEAVVYCAGDYRAVVGRSAPANTNSAMNMAAKKRNLFYVPPGFYLYLRSNASNNREGSVDVYPSDNVGPNLDFHQGAEVREA